MDRSPVPPQASLLEDTVETAGCQIVAGLARDSYPPALDRVLELAMAASRPGKDPPVIMKSTQQLAHFHAPTLGRALLRANNRN
jgi:hypothetical protein